MYTEPMPTAPALSRDELLEVAEGCACTAVRRTARSMTRAYDDAIRPSGLRVTQFSLLVAAEPCGGALKLSEIADILGLERTTVTRDLRPLEKRGLVTVESGQDRRARIVRVTDAGRRTMTDAMPRWRAAQAKLLAGDAADSWPRIAEGLGRLADAAGRE
jgi:DNA-binding MarR family transcriptional regulator